MLIARDGAELPVDDSAAPIRDDSGAITGVVIIFRDITARKQVERQLRHLALHDPLTGLPNRALLMDRLALAFEHTRRYPDHRYAVLYLDLDRFKVINDSLGHLAGDQLLVGVARRLSEERYSYARYLERTREVLDFVSKGLAARGTAREAPSRQ